MTQELLFKNIWILYPNCSDLIGESSNESQGSAGEFIYNLAKYLVRNDYHVIILTSHCPTHMQELFDQGLTFFEKINFTAKGKMFSRYFDKNIEYKATSYMGVLNGVRLVLFHGLNEETQKVLSYNPLGYDSDVRSFIDKAVLLSRIMKEYVNYVGPIEFPDVIHYVNSIFVPAVITLKTEFSYVGKKVGVVFQHVKEPSVLPISNMKEFLLKVCKIENTPHPVYYRKKSDTLDVEEVINLEQNPKLIELGAVESNLILTSDINKIGEVGKIATEKVKTINIKENKIHDSYQDVLSMYSLVIRTVVNHLSKPL